MAGSRIGKIDLEGPPTASWTANERLINETFKENGSFLTGSPTEEIDLQRSEVASSRTKPDDRAHRELSWGLPKVPRTVLGLPREPS